MFELRTTPCAITKSGWEKDRSDFKTCMNPDNVYHCIQDEKNRSGEICIQPIWIQPHYCPEFNTGHWALDTVPCNVTKGCPNVTFLSSDVYQYPVCLNKTNRNELSDHGEYSAPWPWIVLPILLVITLLALATAFLVWRRKGTCRREEDECGHLLLKREEDSEPFHKTVAFHEAKQYLNGGGKFLVLSGIWGSGKTKTAREVYRSVTKQSPTIITNLEKFYCEEHNQSLVFDEAISEDLSDGEMRRLQEKIKAWLEKVSTDETKIFIIFTSVKDRKSTFTYITLASPGVDLKIINLNNRLTKGDRTQILNSHFTVSCPKKAFSEIEDLATKGKHESLGYPEICALFCRCDEFQRKKAEEFCKTPLRSLKLYLENMFHSNEHKFLMLVYMSLNQMEIDVKNPDEMLFNELKTCKSDTQTQAEPLVDTIIRIIRHGNNDDIHSLMSWEFVDKVPKSSKYRLQHDVIKRMTLIVFGIFHFDKLLELTKPEDTEGWIKEDALFMKEKTFYGDIIPRLLVDEDKWKRYVNKNKENTADKKRLLGKPDAPCRSDTK